MYNDVKDLEFFNWAYDVHDFFNEKIKALQNKENEKKT